MFEFWYISVLVIANTASSSIQMTIHVDNTRRSTNKSGLYSISHEHNAKDARILYTLVAT